MTHPGSSKSPLIACLAMTAKHGFVGKQVSRTQTSSTGRTRVTSEAWQATLAMASFYWPVICSDAVAVMVMRHIQPRDRFQSKPNGPDPRLVPFPAWPGLSFFHWRLSCLLQCHLEPCVQSTTWVSFLTHK